MKLLVHTCCADCLFKFSQGNAWEEVVYFYYNPNIHPREEYLTRLRALKKIIAKHKSDVLPGKLLVPNWRPQEYFQALKGIFKQSKAISGRVWPQPEKRCPECWQLRFEKTFNYAKNQEFSHVSSTLLVSKYQNQAEIIAIGQNLAKKYSLKFLVPKDLACDLKTAGFYKQNYCGCCYSLVERLEEKFS